MFARASSLRSRCALIALLALSSTGAARAAGPSPESAPAVDRSAWEDGWHVVRPGDTLEGLAERYLGSHEHWRELHLLNPTVADPNLLFPGQRLRIFLERPTAKLSAQVMAVARDVRELPTPVPWRAASEGDVLLERDALRTAKAASARLRFDDGATVNLSEDSLVFIRRQSQPTSPVAGKEIEIQLGQVDVEGAPRRAATSTHAEETIEVVVGGARARARSTADQVASTRSRKSEGDLAQFMVYGGQSTVSARGASLELPAGSGTSVAPKAPPGPIETLLPAPANARPAYGEEIERAAPEFSWQPVPGADHYLVELCRDVACGAILASAPTSTPAALQLDLPEGLPAGELFWRVTAVAASGLDGYPTPPTRIVAVDSLRPSAPSVILRRETGEAVAAGACLGSAPAIEVRAADRRGQALPWSLALDGREISPAEIGALALEGTHRIVARARDERGRIADSAPLEFTVDRAAPWVDLVVRAHAGSEESSAAEPRTTRRARRAKAKAALPPAACDAPLEVFDGDGRWTPVPCATGAAPAFVERALTATENSWTLRTTTQAVRLGETEIPAGETFTLSTWDVGCGVARLAVRIEPSPYAPGRMLFTAAVSDGAGNLRSQGWHVARK